MIINLIGIIIIIGMITLIPVIGIIIGFQSEKVKNTTANRLLKEIEKLEFVQKASLYKIGPSLIYHINIQTFNAYENGQIILKMAEDYLNVEFVNELIEEYKYPPDTTIDIQDKHGRIFYFTGSCYESYIKNISPDYDHYKWSGGAWGN